MNQAGMVSESITSLGEFLRTPSIELDSAIQKAYELNSWFIPEFTKNAIEAIANEFLHPEKFESWIASYPLPAGRAKEVAIIMAGNVPLVGFHDLFSVLASGNNAVIKLSEKDSFLTKFITDEWQKMDPSLASRIRYVEKLSDYDAVIATGSNNSARYFEYYFRDKSHVLRRNRNGVAILHGNESLLTLKELAKDIFLYFGLGCRNVSKVFVPDGYDFSLWAEAIGDWHYLADHNKYRHNLDYNYAMYIINQVKHINLGHLVLKEDDAISSRIGCVYYSHYTHQAELLADLNISREQIQCVVSDDAIKGWEHVQPGQTQYPSLGQYADGIDTMAFLTSLEN